MKDSGEGQLREAGLGARLARLESKVAGLAEHVTLAIAYQVGDPHASLNKTRSILERLLREAHRSRLGFVPKKATLGDLLANAQLMEGVEVRVCARMRSIQELGNLGSHLEHVTPDDAQRAVDDLVDVIDWFLKNHASELEMENRAAIAAPIQDHFKELGQAIESLTKSQCQTLQFLRGRRRVAIAGCAGSGKTLVATEKAVRCDAAGLRTLVLCHNPLLAARLRSMLIATSIDVFSVAQWLSQLRKASSADDQWTHYHEPSEVEIDEDFDALVSGGGPYDAIVVDEGQDLRNTMWLLVEAALADPARGLLYVFYDDNQTLVPRDWKYPLDEAPFLLSKNCRNAGAIFERVRRFHPQAPEPELMLRDKGVFKQVTYAKGGEVEAVRDSVAEALTRMQSQDLVVLTTEADATTSMLAGLSVRTVPTWSWRDAVLRVFTALPKPKLSTRARSAGWTPEPLPDVPVLSREPLPTEADKQAVANYCRVVRKIWSQGELGVLHRHPDLMRRQSTRWRSDGTIQSLSASATLDFFETEEWAKDLPASSTVTLTPHSDCSEQHTGRLPLYSIGAFKGLEADGAVVLVRGDCEGLMPHLYVAFSRPKALLHAVVDIGVIHRIPALH